MSTVNRKIYEVQHDEDTRNASNVPSSTLAPHLNRVDALFADAADRDSVSNFKTDDGRMSFETSRQLSAIKTKGELADLKIAYSRYEYVIVFPMVGERQSAFVDSAHSEQSNFAKWCVSKMLNANLQVYTFLSLQKDELFVLFTIPPEALYAFAEKVKYPLELDGDKARDLLGKGNNDLQIKAVKIAHDDKYSGLAPFEYIYGPYKRSEHDNLYKIKEEVHHCDMFSTIDRLKLIYMILQAHPVNGGCQLDINKLLATKQMLAVYPLHFPIERYHLLARHVNWWKMPWCTPDEYTEIRDYFGEKTAFFYLFLGHQSRWLIAPSITGIAFQALVWSSGPNYSHPSIAFFSVCINIWGFLFMSRWRQKEGENAMRWGVLGFEEAEKERPGFEGEIIASPVNGRFVRWVKSNTQRFKQCLSAAVVLSTILFVLGAVASIYTGRYMLQNDVGSSASYVASLIMTGQIALFNYAYYYIAQYLNDMENHRTDSVYQDAMIAKLFVFQFINSYVSFFYIAFIAAYMPTDDNTPEGYLGQCGYYNCMYPLSLNLAILYGARLTTNNMLDVVGDFFFHRVKYWHETKSVELSGAYVAPAEKQYFLLPSDPLLDDINHFADVAIQFGYSVLFVTALPVSCFFTLASNYIRVKLQLYRSLKWYQRPMAQGAQDIGIWTQILYLLCLLSVMTNGAIICFTMDVLKSDEEVEPYGSHNPDKPDDFKRAAYSAEERQWVYIGYLVTVFFIQFIIYVNVADRHADVKLQEQRQKFIVSKLIDKVADEDFFETDEDIMFELANFNKDKDDFNKLDQTVQNWQDIPIRGVTTIKADLEECVDPSYLGDVYKPIMQRGKSVYHRERRSARFHDDI